MAWSRPILEHQWRRMLQILQAWSGMDCPENRRQDLMAASAEAAEFAEISDFSILLDQLEKPANQALRSVWISAFTIHETYFFRDSLQWSAIRQMVLPERIKTRQKERTLRIWSAGCSSGEEAYTAAIMARELLPDHDLWNIKIVGTDISSDILQKARKGIYREWAFRQTPIHVRDDYFEPHGEHHWQIRPEIAGSVKFELLNLKTGNYPSAVTGLFDFDLILCRNVLIYFVQDEMDTVLQKLSQCLAPGGFLALGPAEPYPSERTGLELVKSAGTAIFRVANAPSLQPPSAVPKSPIARTPDNPLPAIGIGTFRATASEPKHSQPSTKQEDQTNESNQLASHAGTAIDELKICARQGDWNALLKQAREVSTNDPLNAEACYLLGLALKELGQLNDSRDALRRCLFLNNRHWLGHLLLAGLWQRDGQKQRARSQLNAILTGLSSMDSSENLPETDGMTVDRMRALVDSQLKSLGN